MCAKQLPRLRLAVGQRAGFVPTARRVGVHILQHRLYHRRPGLGLRAQRKPVQCKAADCMRRDSHVAVTGSCASMSMLTAATKNGKCIGYDELAGSIPGAPLELPKKENYWAVLQSALALLLGK